MPRQRRSSPAPSRSNFPARAPPQQPVQHAAPPPPMVVQQQPSMFKQMAATAGGVAVGSAVGHTLGHAMTGMFSGGGSSSDAPAVQAQAPAQAYAPPAQATNQSDPCYYATKQFLECAQQQTDLTLCDGFNEVLRQCRLDHRLSV